MSWGNVIFFPLILKVLKWLQSGMVSLVIGHVLIALPCACAWATVPCWSTPLPNCAGGPRKCIVFGERTERSLVKLDLALQKYLGTKWIALCECSRGRCSWIWSVGWITDLSLSSLRLHDVYALLCLCFRLQYWKRGPAKRVLHFGLHLVPAQQCASPASILCAKSCSKLF